MSEVFQSSQNFPEKDKSDKRTDPQDSKEVPKHDVRLVPGHWFETAQRFTELIADMRMRRPIEITAGTRDLLLAMDIATFSIPTPSHLREVDVPFFEEERSRHESVARFSMNLERLEGIMEIEADVFSKLGQKGFQRLLRTVADTIRKHVVRLGVMSTLRKLDYERSDAIRWLRIGATNDNIATNFGAARLTKHGHVFATIGETMQGPIILQQLAWASILAAHSKLGADSHSMMIEHLNALKECNSHLSKRRGIGGEDFLERDLRKLYIGLLEDSIDLSELALMQRAKLINVDHYVNLYLSDRESEASKEAEVFLQKMGGGCYCPPPYPSWREAQKRLAQKEAQQIVVAGRSESYSFARFAQETKRLPDGTDALFARFIKETCDDVQNVHISSNNHPPGRGWVFSGPQTHKLFFRDEERNEHALFFENNRHWIGHELADFDLTTYAYLRGAKVVLANGARYNVTGQHYAYVVFNDHFTGSYDGAWLFPADIVSKRLKGSLYAADTNPSSDTIDLLERNFTCASLLAECERENRSALNLTWLSTLFGGCGYAFPAMRNPHFGWERHQQSSMWKDVNCHVHLSWMIWNFRDDDGRVDEALKPYQTLGHEVFRTARSYQSLLAVFQNRYAAWKCDQTPGEIQTPRMLREVYRWHNLTEGRPLAERPVLCLMERGQAAMEHAPLLDTATLELVINGQHIAFPQLSDGTENKEISLWRRFVIPYLEENADELMESQNELCILPREYVKTYAV